MADLDIQVQIYPASKSAEALTFQKILYGHLSRGVSRTRKVLPEAQKELNEFLNDWLKNIIEQEYKLVEEEKQYIPEAINYSMKLQIEVLY